MIRQLNSSMGETAGGPRCVLSWLTFIAVVTPVCLWALIPLLLPTPAPGGFLLANPYGWWAWSGLAGALATGLFALATQAMVLSLHQADSRRDLVRLAVFGTAFWLVLCVGDGFFRELRAIAPAPANYEAVYRRMRARYREQLPILLPGQGSKWVLRPRKARQR